MTEKEIEKIMKDFIMKMFSSEGDVSSKRVAGILSLVMAIILGFIDAYGHKISDYVFNGLLLFSAATFGLTVADSFIKK